ncbi:MAG TPA: enoyl-CoA hydratase/isomerase family protein [Kofleriaceae bacterium]|nr:enoyl-CoA hydratase/isomerase family protein [Kofleriaceae bacterium]
MSIIEIVRHGEVAVLHVRAGKGNAMSPTMLTALRAAVTDVDRSDARALVITGDSGFFSAGLALPEIIDFDRAQAREFIDLFADAMRTVLVATLPVVAAINGHAIAGGCVLALQCDARLAANAPIKIGLNEVQLGIGLPAVVVEVLRLRVPASSLAPIALEGNLFEPARARELGLIDELVAPPEHLARAIARASELARGPRAAFAQVKSALSRHAVGAIDAIGADERERWLDTWFTPSAQTILRAAVARLKK